MERRRYNNKQPEVLMRNGRRVNFDNQPLAREAFDQIMARVPKVKGEAESFLLTTDISHVDKVLVLAHLRRQVNPNRIAYVDILPGFQHEEGIGTLVVLHPGRKGRR